MALEQVVELRAGQAGRDSEYGQDIESALKINRRDLSDERMRKFAFYAAEMFEAFFC